MRRLLGTLNKRLEAPLADQQIDRVHDLLWPELENRIKQIAHIDNKPASPHRSHNEMLAEILERIRDLERRVEEIAVPVHASQFKSPVSIERTRTTSTSVTDHVLEEKVAHFRELHKKKQARITALESAENSDKISDKMKATIRAELEKERPKLAQLEVEINRNMVKLTRARQLG